MKDIRITPAVQIGALVAVVGLVVVAIAAQEPELRRYLKMESM